MEDMNKNKIQNISLIILLFALMIAVWFLFKPYVDILFWAVVLYILVNPLYTRVVSKLDKTKKSFAFKRGALAFIFTFGTIIVIGGVVSLVVFLAAGQTRDLVSQVTEFFRTVEYKFDAQFLDEFYAKVYEISRGTIDLRSIDIKGEVVAFVSRYVNSGVQFASSIVTNTGQFIVSIFFVAFTLYFFYVDGNELVEKLVMAVPIKNSDTKKIIDKFKNSITALFQTFFLVAIWQAVIAFIIFLVFGVRASIVLAILVFFCAFIPMFGAAIVWFPIGIVMMFLVSPVKGVIFLIVAGTTISLSDNILRPLLLKNSTKTHPLLLFFSLLGGLSLMGAKGLILGPITLIIFFTVIDIMLDPEIENIGIVTGVLEDEVDEHSKNDADTSKPTDESIKSEE